MAQFTQIPLHTYIIADAKAKKQLMIFQYLDDKRHINTYWNSFLPLDEQETSDKEMVFKERFGYIAQGLIN